MVALSAKLDAPEEAHGGVAPLCLLEHDGVEVLDGDPAEDRPGLLHVALALADQLPHQVSEGLLVRLGHGDGSLVHLGIITLMRMLKLRMMMMMMMMMMMIMIMMMMMMMMMMFFLKYIFFL